MILIDKADGPIMLALMGSLSIWHWLIVLAVVLLLFGGGGKIPRLMKDLGTGVKSFKKGLKDGEAGEAAGENGKAIEGGSSGTTAATENKDKTTAG